MSSLPKGVLGMNLLIISSFYPMPDRASGELRFFQLLRILSQRYKVHFCAIAEKRQGERIGDSETRRYRASLEELGVTVQTGGVVRALRERQYAAVLFEFWSTAPPHMGAVRLHQPDARIVVDSVDVAFNRLYSKAKLTGKQEDHDAARETEAAELDVYKKADVVVTVTDDDANILHLRDPVIRTVTIPNIHSLFEPVKPSQQDRRRLVFVGGFKHKPNVDAMLYFCGEVLPLIVREEPDIHVRIIGSSPTDEIKGLASERVEVLGYVPETEPYLKTSGISIAPLRFGGGMKGKVGEALSHALPVVTTSIGIEGFGLQPGVNVLVGDSAEEFARATLSLLRDEECYERVRMAGYHFIRDCYSEPAVREQVYAFFDSLNSYPLKRITMARYLTGRVKDFIGRQLAWRVE